MEIRRILALARPERTMLIIASVALLVGGSLTLVAPQGLRILLDEVTRGHDRHVLNRTVVELLGLFAISSSFTFVRSYLFTLSGERFVARIRQKLFSHIIGQEVGFFDAQRTGELINRISADTAVLQTSVTTNISMALRNALQALGSLAILMWTSPRLTLVMLGIVPVVALGAMVFARTVRQLSKKNQDALAAANAVAEEALSNIRTVRSFARENRERERYTQSVGESYALGRQLARTYGVFQSTIGFAGSVAIAVVLWYGGTLVIAGTISVGVLTSFMLYTLYLAFGLAALMQLYGDFNRAIGASGRVFELLERKAAIETASGVEPSGVRGEIHFRDVGFAYPTRTDSQVLSSVDMLLSPGRVLALVGRSGSGKSTVASLLARFYDPGSGSITFDGADLRELSPSWLRSQIGTVAQEPVLFATTIADNIRYGNLSASLAEVEAAARAANAHEFISQFSAGYDTLVGERGVRLSGGQKQRVAIARALLKNPRVLVLDEATSALDGESEHLVQEALERLMQGRTVLVIAHRLSTVRGADEVVVLENGRIVERGRHDDLAKRDGAYRRLVEHQFAENVNDV